MLWRAAKFFRNEGDIVHCSLCPHECRLARGEIGHCGLRRHGIQGFETAAGAVSLLHIDPIERKPLYHFRPGSQVVTLAAPGCTFRCRYCQNYRLSQVGRADGGEWSGETIDVAEITGLALARSASIGMSYTEPSLAAEMAVEIGEAAQALSIPLIWKTNGFLTPTARQVFAPLLSAVNIDIKTFDPDKHEALTGAPLRPVLDTIAAFRAADVWVEISTPLIPKLSDDPAAIGRIGRWIAALDPGIPWHLVRFNPDFHMAQYRPTTPDAIATARVAALDAGVQFVYVERGLGSSGRQTICPSCGEVVIDREIWRLGANKLTSEGRCPHCDHRIAGPLEGKQA